MYELVKLEMLGIEWCSTRHTFLTPYIVCTHEFDTKTVIRHIPCLSSTLTRLIEGRQLTFSSVLFSVRGGQQEWTRPL